MADIFLSYARANQDGAAAIARGLEAGGRSLWWDRRLAGGDDYAMLIERELDSARCVVVAWSAAARSSLWVRAEANAALDRGKLVQVNLDATRPPLPFTALHSLDLGGWGGRRDQAPFPDLEAQVERRMGGAVEPTGGFRPDPGGVPVETRLEPALQGFGTLAALGWAAVATTLVLAIAVLMVVRDGLSAAAFGAVSVVALVVALALLAGSAFLLVRTVQASSR